MGTKELGQSVTGTKELGQGVTGTMELEQGVTGTMELEQGVTGTKELGQGVTGTMEQGQENRHQDVWGSESQLILLIMGLMSDDLWSQVSSQGSVGQKICLFCGSSSGVVSGRVARSLTMIFTLDQSQ
jgi:hypothetical protein